MKEINPDNQFVPMKRGTSTRLLVGEAPGQEEAEAGEPFVGGSGRWLNAMLPKAGINRETLNIINVIQCRPPENVFPGDPDSKSYISKDDAERAINHCIKSHVLPVLEGHPWTRIDLVGDKALQYIGGRTEGIFQWRGSPIEVDTDEIRSRVEKK